MANTPLDPLRTNPVEPSPTEPASPAAKPRQGNRGFMQMFAMLPRDVLTDLFTQFQQRGGQAGGAPRMRGRAAPIKRKVIEERYPPPQA